MAIKGVIVTVFANAQFIKSFGGQVKIRSLSGSVFALAYRPVPTYFIFFAGPVSSSAAEILYQTHYPSKDLFVL